MRTFVSFACSSVIAVALCAPSAALAVGPLPALNIDIHETSVSGMSSGGFMAVQLQIAHSAIIKGAGVVAGGPYYCAQNSALTAASKCSCGGAPAISCEVSAGSARVTDLLVKAYEYEQRGLIDSLNNLAHQRAFTISGQKDTVVPPAVVGQLSNFYLAAGLKPAHLRDVNLTSAAHTFPTRYSGAACDAQESPFIGNCRFDAAEAILGWVYGRLRPTTATSQGRFIEYDQSLYTPRRWLLSYTGLDRTGWAYIPNSCEKGEPCRLHVVLHGCMQGQNFRLPDGPNGDKRVYGKTFIEQSGYDKVADTNHLVILFPQAVSTPILNDGGCWDWWGFTGNDYATRNGVQIRAIKAMIDQLTSGRQGG